MWLLLWWLSEPLGVWRWSPTWPVIAHLYLYEKNPADWTIVEDGAWGKMKYNLSGEEFDFVFNGHELVLGVEYELIYYIDPFDQTQRATQHSIMCLGTGTANGGGNVHIAASVDSVIYQIH